MDYNELTIMGISLGLGLLVGLQREHAVNKIAGIRTFPIITFLGTLCGFIAEQMNSIWMVAAGGLALALIIASSNIANSEKMDSSLGQTTEVSALLMYVLGAYLVYGDTTIAVVTGGVIAVLLQIKSSLHNWVKKLGEKEMHAIMQFAAISLIILPILPDKYFGPHGVLNPHEIWLMVVLIVGLSVGGYFVYKLFGPTTGTLSSGILGGMISSTATTLTYAKRGRGNMDAGLLATFIITTASAVSFLRIIIEVAVVAPGFLNSVAPPLGVLFLFMTGVCVWLYFKVKQKNETMPEPSNPAQLKSALIFGAFYGLIIFAVAVAEDNFGNSGLYVVSIISGLTNVDAITLSLSNTVDAGNLDATTGWKLILTGALSNLVFKAGMAIVIGKQYLRRHISIAFGATLIAGLLVLFLWPY